MEYSKRELRAAGAGCVNLGCWVVIAALLFWLILTMVCYG